MTKKKPTEKEVEKILKSVSARGDLVQFFFTVAIELEGTKAKEIALQLMSIYTMGLLNGLGYKDETLVGNIPDEESKVN